MPDNRSYCIAGMKYKTVIEELSPEELALRICRLDREGYERYRTMDQTIETLRITIRKGRQLGFSGKELEPYRRELRDMLLLRFWFKHRKRIVDIPMWNVPVVRRTDTFELVVDAAIRTLNEINTTNGTNYSFS